MLSSSALNCPLSLTVSKLAPAMLDQTALSHPQLSLSSNVGIRRVSLVSLVRAASMLSPIEQYLVLGSNLFLSLNLMKCVGSMVL